LATNTVITGIAESPPMRKSQQDLKGMVVDAVLAALADAGIAPGEVDGIVTDGGVMPHTVSHDYVGAQLGLTRYFDASISNAGTGIVCAPMLADMAIRSGQAKVVVSYFGVDWGTRPDGPYGFHDTYPAKHFFERPHGFHGQPAYFALWARRYMHEFGLTEQQLGAMAVNQRENALKTGRSQSTKPLTMGGYLDSRMVADPLRVPDCCLISDGAAAFVMTSAERAADCPRPPVRVLGVGYASSSQSADQVFTQNPDLWTIPGAAEASQRALAQAGITAGDVDFAELYDCFTISELLQIEDIGFCGKGEGGAFVEAGHTRLDGSIPINTHGGLLSYSYLLGVEHVVEAVRQLRHEAGANQVPNAEVGLVSGLTVPEFGVLVLGA